MFFCYQQNIENDELRQITSQPELSRLAAARVVRWFGHVVRMGENRLAKKVFMWEPNEVRKRGRRPAWKNEAIKKARILEARGHRVEYIQYELARNREEWRKLHQSVRTSTIMTGRIAEKAETF